METRMETAAVRRTHARGAPTAAACVAACLCWATFRVAGSLAATGLLVALLLATTLRCAFVASERGPSAACAHASRWLAPFVAAFSAVIVLNGLASELSPSRRLTEDALELAVIHAAMVGPLYAIGVVTTWLGRSAQSSSWRVSLAYPLSWIAILLIERAG
jgi:hypothetical protein